MIYTSTKALIYVEIFQSEVSKGPLKIKQVNPNNQYRDLVYQGNYLYQDTFHAQAGQQYFYRIENSDNFYTNFYFKYQVLTSSSDQDVYQLRDSQTPKAQFKKNKIFLSIPSFNQYQQTIYYKIIITSNLYDSNLIQCSFGDEELLSKMNTTNYYAIYYHKQTDYESKQQFVTDYLYQFDQDVLIYVFGFIQHRDFNQTVPYNSVYLAKTNEVDYKLLYILAPVIIFAFALLSILVAYLCLKKKRQSEQQSQNYGIENTEITLIMEPKQLYYTFQSWKYLMNTYKQIYHFINKFYLPYYQLYQKWYNPYLINQYQSLIKLFSFNINWIFFTQKQNFDQSNFSKLQNYY
ncbi:unnamed protein product [Paramecium sonneborni]|uniref:Transmembrane protein n=1 Tax=Paramecium sonneborni TaxID=65129 RepID=A0A8S1RRE7_9CILI|nr:unnamed protein product [Paramecium sonneborni]